MERVIGRATVSLEQKSLGTGPLLQNSALQGASESEDRPTRGFQPAGFPRLIAPTAIGVSGAEQELPEESQINSFSRHSGSAHTSRQPSSLRGRKEHCRCGPETKFARGACRPRLQRPRRSTAMAECARRGPRVRRVWRLPGLPTLVPSRPQLTLFWPGAQNPLSRHLARGSRIEERLSTQSAGWLRSVGFTRKHVARVTVAVPGTGREGSGDPLRISSDFCSSSQ